jgi:nucleoside-diphosphate-sugar epimerase
MDKKELNVKRVLVTGSDGFIGKNLIEGLQRKEDVEIKAFDIQLSCTFKKGGYCFSSGGCEQAEGH